MVLLVDDAKDPRQIPTRKNILDAMRWLVKDAHPHDSLFFHCTLSFSLPTFVFLTFRVADSGHGGQVKDRDGDEIDGWDEGSISVLTQNSGIWVNVCGSYIPGRLPESRQYR